jgi:hypothetical protein
VARSSASHWRRSISNSSASAALRPAVIAADAGDTAEAGGGGTTQIGT